MAQVAFEGNGARRLVGGRGRPTTRPARPGPGPAGWGVAEKSILGLEPPSSMSLITLVVPSFEASILLSPNLVSVFSTFTSVVKLLVVLTSVKTTFVPFTVIRYSPGFSFRLPALVGEERRID